MAKSRTPALRPDTGTKSGVYFLSLTVENVRCFGPAQTLDLSDGHGGHAHWTIILGENGLGKTTLLTCLAVSASSGSEDARSWNWDDRLTKLLRTQGFEAKASAVFTAYALGETHKTVSIFIRHSSFRSVGVADDLVGFQYGATRRMPPSRSLAGDDQRLTVFLDDDVALRDPEDWLLTADYNARLRGRDGERFDAFAKRVREALIDILPEVTDLRIQAAEAPGGAPLVEARTRDGWVPLRQLGFGYQSQAAWLVDLASRMFERYPDSPDPLAEPAVVLVDEIDLHMHPRWQRQIIEFLGRRFPQTQFIVTAHSPLIVQAAGDANIVLLRREGDHVVIDNDPERLRNWRVDQILTSELFGLESARPPQIEQPLKERRQILGKARLSARDRKRLAELEGRIGDLPAGESAEDRRAMELLRRAATKLSGDA